MAGPILVTGATGFAGPHLLAELVGQGAALDADVTDAEAVARAVRAGAPAAVVHLAALSSVGESWDEPGEVWRVNVVGTVNVLEAARAEGRGVRVLFASAGELACVQAARDGLDIVVARAFQHEGPGRDERFAVGSWAAQIARAEEAGRGTVRVGGLSARRDITDVRDVCRAYALLLDPSVPAGTYNVASVKAVSMQEVLDLFVGLARCPLEIEADPARNRPAEIPVLCGDASRLRAATGWEPRIPLEQTLADTLEAAREAATEKVRA